MNSADYFKHVTWETHGKKAPNVEDFLAQTDTELILTPKQIQIAKALIEYKSIIMLMGNRSGKSTVINLVDKYLQDFKIHA